MINSIGEQPAATIRAAAAELAAIPDITRASGSREILHDLSHALDDLAAPIEALIEDDLAIRVGEAEDEEFARTVRAAVTALRTAASGIQWSADNH
ncbi:hypothetical protein ACWGNE_02255 [Streptomyces xiamenensis]